MDKPINGDKYVRTLAHYLRTNQRRLLPTLADSANSSPRSSSGARSLLTPADPMAAVYSGMVNSLWSVGSAVVSTITPSGSSPPPPSSSATDRDAYTGAWDGTSTIPADANPRERLLYLQAQLKAPIFPLDLYYLLYLLDRFEQVGIEVEGWDGSAPRAVGDSNPRVLGHDKNNNSNDSTSNNNTSAYSSFPPPTASSTRPQSIRSFSSTALSTLTLITGWKQWSSAASSNNNSNTVNDDIHFIHKFLKQISGLRLVAKIPPGLGTQTKGRIEDYNGDAILSLFSGGSDSVHPLLLPLAGTFKDLTHLELHKIPPRCIEGWESLMTHLKSLVIVQAGIEDVYDVIVTSVVNSERRRRQRVFKERNRAVMIKQEQREALKDAALISSQQRHDSAHTIASSPSSPLSPLSSSTSSLTADGSPSGINMDQDWADASDKEILSTIKMWPILRHLSVSDNALPSLTQSETFVHSPAIVTLDLSHNLFLTPPAALIHLHNLHSLNMSYNMINSVQSIYQILGNIAVLDLKSNRLESLCGLERLWNLEKVDVRENRLDEAAEIGRLAALPGIREVWSDRNPFCATQPRHRLEILAVFKANGHDLLLDGTFASYTEKRSLVNMSPSSLSTTLSSISNVNLANIPAASAPTATFAKDLNKQFSTQSPSGSGAGSPSLSAATAAVGNTASKPREPIRTGSAALLAGTNGQVSSLPTNKLVKKKLVKSSKRVQRIVNLDSDHEEDAGHYSDCDHEHSEGATTGGVLGPAAVIEKKKKKKKKAASPMGEEKEGLTEPISKSTKTKKKGTKKKNGGDKENGGVSFAADNDGHATLLERREGEDHSKCRDNQHVHRLAQLEQSMANLNTRSNNNTNNNNNNNNNTNTSNNNNNSGGSATTSPQRPKSILKRPSVVFGVSEGYLRPSSPTGTFSGTSDDSHGGADGYRRKIEAMRVEAGSNWLKVLAEMERDGSGSGVRD
ncbi:hypothetical protein BG004_007995 [Podila humilis]|nr:hypothetical protein BG004_007995 [Podila humilis]